MPALAGTGDRLRRQPGHNAGGSVGLKKSGGGMDGDVGNDQLAEARAALVGDAVGVSGWGGCGPALQVGDDSIGVSGSGGRGAAGEAGQIQEGDKISLPSVTVRGGGAGERGGIARDAVRGGGAGERGGIARDAVRGGGGAGEKGGGIKITLPSKNKLNANNMLLFKDEEGGAVQEAKACQSGIFSGMKVIIVGSDPDIENKFAKGKKGRMKVVSLIPGGGSQHFHIGTAVDVKDTVGKAYGLLKALHKSGQHRCLVYHKIFIRIVSRNYPNLITDLEKAMYSFGVL
ncbi:hypothetical protein PR202_ga28751 [Eleusine coracana subsp. coracana]|uniref:Uncharacterized protein n=1 Tax=Eleusine coracana subsp. coracana TaxID=191504 RepID=A0AAV5DJL2_ELECO|nr:hypothetical protein PR202_ga28751 [Eleusine coracana subsp. coracana]